RPSPRIAASNAGFEGASGAGAQSPCFARPLHLFLPVTANYLPVTAKLSPCYCPVPRAPPIFLKPLLLKLIFLQKPVRRPPILPVSRLLSGSIRENQGAKPLSNPGLILPSSLPSKLGWSPGDHKGEENASNRASFGGVSASLRSRRSSRSKSPANRARRMG